MSAETTATARIRWEPTAAKVLTGHVGTDPSVAFRLCPTPEWWEESGGPWMLTFELPATPGEIRYGNDPDALKAEAEHWLEEFVSSLGAVFPEAVLKLTDEFGQEAARFDCIADHATESGDTLTRVSALSASQAYDRCAKAFREAITSALLSQKGSSGDG